MREFILAEIKRIAAESGGKSPGRDSFAKQTGITPAKWTGVYWAKWSDALADAGLTANSLQQRLDSRTIAASIARFSREIGRIPTRAELKLRAQTDKSLPSLSAIGNHFPTNDELTAALRKLAAAPEYADIAALLPSQSSAARPAGKVKAADGVVYLLKSGQHYKIGRTDNIERRVREISVALPEAMVLVHAIRTDDPTGIEAYWHRRFADHRANGEWFGLSPEDVKACRRSFQ